MNWTRNPESTDLPQPLGQLDDMSRMRCATESAAEPTDREARMDRAELKAQIDELMRQYDNGEIDGGTYSEKMMELTTSGQD